MTDVNDAASVLDAARDYLGRGYPPIPVPFRKKRPVLEGWPSLRLSDENLGGYFNGRPQNLGILTGAPSRGLTDADLDAPEAVALAPRFLPRTASVFGRPGKPRSHWLYVCDPVVPTAQLEDPDGTMLAELRSTGVQTIFPPSTHESGEPIRWHEDGEPLRIDGRVLLGHVKRLAAATILARHWPEPGSRHQASPALGGGLLRGGWSEDDTADFALAIAEAAGDEEAAARAENVRTTARRLADDRQATGWPTLAQLLVSGERVVDKAREWLGIRDAGPLGARTFDGERAAPPSVGATLVRLSDVTPRRVRWLWPHRIPLGKLTIVDGDPDLGKSAVTLNLAARVSCGESMPDGTRGDVEGPAGVVLMSAEDGLEDTIRPRLDAAGGDPERVAALTIITSVAYVREPSTGGMQEVRTPRLPTLADLDAIRSAVRELGARLVVIDPVMAYLPTGTDSSKDQDVRSVLARLAGLADEEDVAVVVVRHLNKSAGGNPLYRGGGSIGIIGAARSALLVARDPDDATGARRVVAPLKGNLAAPAPALAYHLEAAPNGAVRVVWEGETDHTAARLLSDAAANPDERSARDEAGTFLREVLERGRVRATDVYTAATSVGISRSTLDRAKRSLQIQVTREGFGKDGIWWWSLPSANAFRVDGEPIDRHERHRSSPPEREDLWQDVSIYGAEGTGFQWRCTNCGALESRPLTSGRHRCEGCGAVTDGDGRVVCLGCDGPAEDGQRLRCLTCVEQARKETGTVAGGLRD